MESCKVIRYYYYFIYNICLYANIEVVYNSNLFYSQFFINVLRSAYYMNSISFDRFVSKKVIEINDMYPILIFDEEESLTVECPWRLKNKDIIVVGGGEYKSQETHQKANAILSKLLLGQQISGIRINSAVSDLFMEFSNGVTLELFCDSSIYEGWTLSDGKDFLLISLPGGGFSFR